MSDKRRREKAEARRKLKVVAAAGFGPAGSAAAGGGKSRVIWLSAFIFIISGYILMRKADPGGQNYWSIASPALLLAGYLLIIPAILTTYWNKGAR